MVTGSGSQLGGHGCKLGFDRAVDHGIADRDARAAALGSVVTSQRKWSISDQVGSAFASLAIRNAASA
jgi:hypothetical protein